jgi:uncharacterized protein
MGKLSMLLEENEYIVLEENNNCVYLTVVKKGFSMLSLTPIISRFPRITLTNFKGLKEAVTKGVSEKIQIGDWKPEIEWMVSEDKMKASIKMNCSAENLVDNYAVYVGEILNGLKQQRISEGIDFAMLHKNLVPCKEITIARGAPPVDGEDSKITYYKLSERKPNIREDGKADFYDMNFLDEVKKGDWLGEKLPPTDGTPGKTITGESVMAKKGKELLLNYDRRTVAAVKEEGKVVLRALIDGVVEYQSGKILIEDHLSINDVGIETGNIEFEGSVTIRGTVMDGFSVSASKDISIQGEFAVTGIGQIVARKGDIYIRGGIFGKNKSRVKAGRNIFVKHANECFLEAGENIYIGYYSLGSHLKAKNIVADERKGKLIGGVIEATGMVKAAVIGNRLERKTVIHVTGFDREEVKRELHQVLLSYKEKMRQLEKINSTIGKLDELLYEMNSTEFNQYELAKNQFETIMADIMVYEDRRRSLTEMLDIKGEGEVAIGTEAFPETLLQIKSRGKKLNQITKGIFYVKQNHLHFEN